MLPALLLSIAVHIDTVVTDKAGQRVAGLAQDAFEVLEDGRKQTITSFQEGDASRPRRFVVFIDNDSLQAAARKPFFAGLRAFVGALRPGDQVSVVNWTHNLQVAAPLTADKTALLAAIDAAEASPSPGAARASDDRVKQQCQNDMELVRASRVEFSNAYNDCLNKVRAAIAGTLNDARLLMNAVNVSMNLAAGAEGKKALVLAGAGLQQSPGPELFRFAHTLFAQARRSFATAPGEREMGEDQNLPPELLDRLARSANAHGISIYTVNAGDTDDAPFETLSSMTGGTSVMRPADFGAALGNVAADLDSSYSIGYQSPDEAGRDRVVLMRVKNPGYTVRARRSYAPRTADEQMSDRVVANIYAPAAKSELPVAIRAGTPERGEKGFRVPLQVTFPATLGLTPEEGKLTGGFTIFMAVGNKQGMVSTLTRSPQAIAVPATEEALFRKSPISFPIDLTINPGENFVSIAIQDQVTKAAGFARTTVVTP